MIHEQTTAVADSSKTSGFAGGGFHTAKRIQNAVELQSSYRKKKDIQKTLPQLFHSMEESFMEATS